jgi:hypothetical protein
MSAIFTFQMSDTIIVAAAYLVSTQQVKEQKRRGDGIENCLHNETYLKKVFGFS